MKMKTLGMVIFLLLSAGTLCFGTGEETKTDGASVSGQETVKVPAPLAIVLQPVHEFEPVLEGDEVVHSFAVENKGDAELVIERVQTT